MSEYRLEYFDLSCDKTKWHLAKTIRHNQVASELRRVKKQLGPRPHNLKYCVVKGYFQVTEVLQEIEV